MPWFRRVYRIGPLSFFRDDYGRYYLRWARGALKNIL